MLRRSIVNTGCLAAVGGVLAACGAGSSAATPAQIIADAQGALQGLANVIPALYVAKPPVISKAEETSLSNILAEGLAFMKGIGPGTPAQTGASTLATIEGYLNAVLTILTPIAAPPPYNLIIIAAAVIVPEVEAYIASIIPTPRPPVAAGRVTRLSRGHPMTLEQARQTLKIAS